MNFLHRRPNERHREYEDRIALYVFTAIIMCCGLVISAATLYFRQPLVPGYNVHKGTVRYQGAKVEQRLGHE